MFVDAFHDRKKDKIKVVERVDGKRVFKEYPVDWTFYYEHPQGVHKSIFGDPCKKFHSNSSFKFKSELGKMRASGVRIFESDINPLFRALETHYKGCDAPRLNVAYFDIETGFCQTRGFAPPEDPFNPITAITVQLDWLDALITLVLKPSTITFEQADKICSRFSNTLLFNDESELIKAFATVIEDADVLTGWNCLPLSNTVWKNNRITSLNNIKKSDQTFNYGSVKNTHRSGFKPVNTIRLCNGVELKASDEHRIPVMSKMPKEYKYPSSLERSRRDMTVAEMKARQAAGEMLYVTLPLRKNDNSDLTFRRFLVDNLDTLYSYDDFDLFVPSMKMRDAAVSHYRANGTFEVEFQYSRLVTSFEQYQRRWATRNHPCVERELIRQCLEEVDYVDLILSGNRSYRLDNLDKPIHEDLFRILGLLYTDGTYWDKKKRFTLYGKEPQQMELVSQALRTHIKLNSTARYALKKNKVDMISFDFKRSSEIGLLAFMVYNTSFKKCINIEMMSTLSETQFKAFFTGLVEGDGHITTRNLFISNYDGALHTIQELLAWNGVYSTIHGNKIMVSNNRVNESFIKSLTFWNRKGSKMSSVRFFDCSNSPSKDLRKFVFEDRVILRVDNIEESGVEVEMGDIETDDHYFVSGGVVVHNSEMYDIPYIVNRIQRSCTERDEITRQLCLWGEKPKPRTLEKFKRKFKSYELVGRVHMDYLALYQKHNTQQLHSYRLDYVGEVEVGENKVPYEGTLDELWKNDFDKFIAYSRQDVALLAKIEAKKKLIDLSNQVAHTNCVPILKTLGSVALIEQAIILEMHDMGFVVPDKGSNDDPDEGEDDEERGPVVGAYVADPEAGLHDYVGAIDINSLYPSVLRSLNASPETIMGQIRSTETEEHVAARVKALGKAHRAEAWEGLFHTLEYGHIMARDDAEITIDFEDGRVETKKAREWYDYIFDPTNNLCISANGTLFRTDLEGMIPALLTRWYANRKSMQKKSKEFRQLSNGFHIPDDLAAQLREALRDASR